MSFLILIALLFLLVGLAVVAPFLGALLDKILKLPSPVEFQTKLERAITEGERLIDSLRSIDFNVYGELRKSTDKERVIRLRDDSVTAVGRLASFPGGKIKEGQDKTELEREIEAILKPIETAATFCFSGGQVSASLTIYPYGDVSSGGFKPFFEKLAVAEPAQSSLVRKLSEQLKSIRDQVPAWEITLTERPNFGVIEKAVKFITEHPASLEWQPLDGLSPKMKFLVSTFKSKSRSKQTLDFLSALLANYHRTVTQLVKLKLESEVKQQKFNALFDQNFSDVIAGIESKRRALLDRIDGYITETDQFYKACREAENTQDPALAVRNWLGSLKISLVSQVKQDRQEVRLLSTAFDSESKVLLVEFYVPSLKVTLETYRVLADKPTQRSLREVAHNYLPAMGLALARKALDCLGDTRANQVVINLKTQVVDPSTGHVSDHYVFSALFPSDRLKSLVFANLDPLAACNKFQVRNDTFGDVDQVVSPLLIPEDDRIVESRDVNSSLSQGQNLAALDWEDFEHLVRQLFERLFAGKGATVSVTRASKDKGVDAIVFDPTPVTGFGKIVIQAKRYVNTVDVSAVRDLYGTVINEGATKGILVTTSKFGPDAVSFAYGKPLEFIDGANLVQLMGSVEMGSYRVDLDEARRLLGLKPNR